ncbi:hypothetical protein E4U41_000368 [Claviceps citrina]|nr:hypothetical protein E4U41_000368 [Claviceps citrina]
MFDLRDSMAKSRLAPALQVFQILQRYPMMIRPRCDPEVPIGRKPAQGDVLCRGTASPQSLYHELGVLVFAGTNAKQTQEIGHISRHVLAWGGPGGTAMRLGWWSAPEMGEAYARLNSLNGDALKLTTDESRERNVKKDGLIMPTIVGPRLLPLDSFARFYRDVETSRMVGEIHPFAVGTGAHVGAAKTEYDTVYPEGCDTDPEAGSSSRCDGFVRGMELGLETHRERLDEVVSRLLGPLWVGAGETVGTWWTLKSAVFTEV